MFPKYLVLLSKRVPVRIFYQKSKNNKNKRLPACEQNITNIKTIDVSMLIV